MYAQGIVPVVGLCLLAAGMNSRFTFQSVILAGLTVFDPEIMFTFESGSLALSQMGSIVLLFYSASLILIYARS